MELGESSSTVAMSSEPSTSKITEDASERSKLLKQALGQASVQRAQKMKNGLKQRTQRKNVTVTDYVRIRSHPLYPVLELLCTKCEQAMRTMTRPTFEMNDVVELFNNLEHQGVTGKTDDHEVDQLMYNSIISLRTCLVELERVMVLSNSFEEKYLAAIRRSLSHEVLVGAGIDSDDDISQPVTPESDQQQQTGSVGSTMATLTTPNGTLSIPVHITQQSITMIPSAAAIESAKQDLHILQQLACPQMSRMLPPMQNEPKLETKSVIDDGPDNLEENIDAE